MPLPRLAAAALSTLLVVAACGDDTDTGATGVVEPAAGHVAGLTYTTFDGEQMSFDDRIGTPMVVNFFAEWCVNCITEMPEFEAVSRELTDRVDFVGLSIDAGATAALALVDATGVTYDVGWDPGQELYAHFEGLSMPTTAFVDETGTITRVWSGVLSAEALREKIDEEIL